MKATNYLPRYESSHALIIGIDEYKYVPPLANACADARAVSEVLVGHLGFPKSNVTLLLNADATSEKIREQFLAFESLDPNARVLFFFAGHGDTVNGHHGPIGYLIPVDGRPADRSSFIRWTQLTQDSDLIPAKHILFIMDACYSGLAMQRAARSAGSRFIYDMLQRRSRQVITAGKADEPVSDGGGPIVGHSIFTGHLLEGLAGKAANPEGVLTASYLMDYVYRRVSNDPNSQQSPHFGHVDGDGDFIFHVQEDTRLSAEKLQDYVVAQVPERPETLPSEVLVNVKPVFADRNGYSDPDSAAFGKNDWTARLGMHARTGKGQSEFQPASHWLSIVVEPVSNEPIALDIGKLNKALRNQVLPDNKPHDQLRLPSQAITTSKSLVLYDDLYRESSSGKELWKRFLRIESNGAMEYSTTSGVSGVYWVEDTDQSKRGHSIRLFSYINAIGVICNAVFAMKRILVAADYKAGVRLLVNFTGTRDSLMVQFANGIAPGGVRWLQPFEPLAMFEHSLSQWRCHEVNLQLEYKLVLETFGEQESNKLIEECAGKLGLAYNHQSEPRCFIHGTNKFPWNELDPYDCQ